MAEVRTMTKRAVLYARISQATEESVSVARQVEAGRALAAARGWQVVGTYVDDGVSATKNRPEDRAGWQAPLARRGHLRRRHHLEGGPTGPPHAGLPLGGPGPARGQPQANA